MIVRISSFVSTRSACPKCTLGTSRITHAGPGHGHGQELRQAIGCHLSKVMTELPAHAHPNGSHPSDLLDTSLTLAPLDQAARAALDVLYKHDAHPRIQEQRATIARLREDLDEHHQIILKKNQTISILKEHIALYEACEGLTVADVHRAAAPGDEPLIAHLIRVKALRMEAREEAEEEVGRLHPPGFGAPQP